MSRLRGALLTLQDTFRQMKQAQLLLVASSLAYTTILSVIPLLAVSFAIFRAFGGMKAINETIEPFIVSNLAEGVSDEVIARIEGFIRNAHASVIGASGVVGLVVTSMSMLYNIERAINRVWHAPMSRSLFRRLAYYWIFITLGPLAVAIGVGAATSLELPLASVFPSGAGAFAISIVIFFALYKWVPHTRVSSRCAAISAAVIAVVFHLAQAAFRFYTSRMINYGRIYGSVGAVPVLLLWIYIVWIVVLSGAAFSSALQKRVDARALPV